jgi:hypothetical protein
MLKMFLDRRSAGFFPLLLGVFLAFSVIGCDDTDPGDPSLPGGGAGATATPDELRGTWYEYDSEDGLSAIPEFAFTEYNLLQGDPNGVHTILLVRVNGKKIDYSPNAEAAQGGLWAPFCTSYNLSGGSLTFSGGIMSSYEGTIYRQTAP